jgi:8-oxo-dGTP diphosphatase
VKSRSTKPHIIWHEQPADKGRYPACFYRVSAKAVILNSIGHVLVIQEKNGHWDLPGGGVEHGEDTDQALVRELREEL